MSKLRKHSKDYLFFGVCGGIGRRTGISSTWWRLAFVVAFVGFGLGALLYVLLAIFMPRDDYDGV